MIRRSVRLGGALGGLVLLAVSVGCSARAQTPPGAGYERGGVPELGGARVMLLPVQVRTGAHPDIGRELEFAFGQAGSRIEWILPVSLDTALRNSPGTGIRLDAFAVGAFRAAELQRVGDPLFGELYRLGVLVGAEYALLPVEARARAHEEVESVEISAALLETRTGRVLWFGIVAGTPGAPGTLAPTATAAEALARRVAF